MIKRTTTVRTTHERCPSGNSCERQKTRGEEKTSGEKKTDTANDCAEASCSLCTLAVYRTTHTHNLIPRRRQENRTHYGLRLNTRNYRSVITHSHTHTGQRTLARAPATHTRAQIRSRPRTQSHRRCVPTRAHTNASAAAARTRTPLHTHTCTRVYLHPCAHQCASVHL